jgi:hypothetical protein
LEICIQKYKTTVRPYRQSATKIKYNLILVLVLCLFLSYCKGQPNNKEGEIGDLGHEYQENSSGTLVAVFLSSTVVLVLQ